MCVPGSYLSKSSSIGRTGVSKHSSSTMSSPGARYGLRSQTEQIIFTAGKTSRSIWTAGRGLQDMSELTKVPSEQGFVFGSGLCLLPEEYNGGGLALTAGEKRSCCWKYMFQSPEWLPLPDLPAERWGHGSVCLSNMLMVVGGSLPREWTGRVDFLLLEDSQESQEWQEGPAAPEPLYCPKVCSIGDVLYALDDHTGKLFALNVNQEEWSTLASLGKGIGGSAMVAANRKLYVAGGEKNVSYIYDPVADVWTEATKPILSHNHASLVSYQRGKKLLLMGGHTDSVDEYDVTASTWSVSTMKLPVEMTFGHGLTFTY